MASLIDSNGNVIALSSNGANAAGVSYYSSFINPDVPPMQTPVAGPPDGPDETGREHIVFKFALETSETPPQPFAYLEYLPFLHSF